jgi:lysophospholipid hydrolase
MLATKTTARKELVLLHDDRTVPPGSTRPWLRNRPWLQAHHHVELPGVVAHKAPAVHDPKAVAAFKHLREEVRTRLKAYRRFRPLGRPRRPPHMNDFARIARRLCGRQIGLCLGGGGARGISHLGMLQALEEYGIPIDAIGGCSIGSFVGGLYARETDLLEAAGRTKQFAGRMGSMLRILSDVTYPYASYTTGHEFSELSRMWI